MQKLGAKSQGDEIELKKFRNAIDVIDEHLVCLLAERFVWTQRVGEIKARIQEPALDPKRQTDRAILLNELAEKFEVDIVLLRQIFSAIQEVTQKSHKRIASLRQLRICGE